MHIAAAINCCNLNLNSLQGAPGPLVIIHSPNVESSRLSYVQKLVRMGLFCRSVGSRASGEDLIRWVVVASLYPP